MKRLFSAIAGAVVRFGFSVLLLWLRLLYRPSVRFEGKHGKELFRSPAVIISNHKTHKDGGLLPLALGRRHIVTFVAKDWYEDPKYHRYLRHLPYLPLDRKEWDTAWLDEGLRALAERAGGTMAVEVCPAFSITLTIPKEDAYGLPGVDR